MRKLTEIISLLSLATISFLATAESEEATFPSDELPIYSEDKLVISMQHGMKIYMNNCMGCHSLAFQRYNRAAKDLQMSEDAVINNLMFSSEKIGDLMNNNMQKESSEKWFGAAPPDLSLVARARGTKWLYNYFRGFYKDDSRPYGVNNSVFKDVGMPHALERLQGLQDKTEAVKGLENDIEYALGDIASAQEKRTQVGNKSELSKAISDAEQQIHKKQLAIEELASKGEYFTLVKEGTLTPTEFNSAMTDLVYFLDYVGEPIKRERKAMGVYVLLFILFFTFVAYLMKKEYWKDVH